MSEPEISHRCPSCGASIRQRASFCQQCGWAVTRDAGAVTAIETETDGTAADAARSGDSNESTPSASNTGISDGQVTRRLNEPNLAQTLATARPEAETAPAALATDHAGVEADGSGMPDSRVKVRRATAVARDVLEDNVRPRVDKLRRASSVVLDEASYDPSLRFVLVAAVLFVLFLILLLLSKWVG